MNYKYLLWAVLLPLSALADVEWSGINSNDWSTTNNWIGDAKPAAGETALFDSAGASQTPTLSDGSETIGAIQFQGEKAYSLDVSHSTLTVGTATSTGNLITSTTDADQHIGISASPLGTSTLSLGGGTVAPLGNGALTISTAGGAVEIMANASTTIRNTTISLKPDDDPSAFAGQLILKAGTTGTTTLDLGGSTVFLEGSEDHSSRFTLEDATSLTGGTVTNNTNGIFEVLDNATARIRNITIHNNPPTAEGDAGSTNFGVGSVVDMDDNGEGTTIIENFANTTSGKRGQTLIEGSISGPLINNKGGITSVSGTVQNLTINNFMDASGAKAGHTVIGNGSSWNTSTMGFEVTKDTGGVALITGGHTFTLDTNSSLAIFVDPNTTFTNHRHILFAEFQAEAGTNAVNIDGPIRIVSTEDQSDLTDQFTVTHSTDPTEVTAGNLNINSSDLPENTLFRALYTIILGQTNQLSDTAQTGLKSMGHGTTHVLSRVHSAVHTIIKKFAHYAHEFSLDTNRPHERLPEGLSFRMLQKPDIDRDPLSNTEATLGLMAEQTAKQLSPLRTSQYSLWAQPFGQIIDQGNSSSGLGHNAKTAGIVFGGDYRLSRTTVMGLALGSAQNVMETKSVGHKTQIKDRFVTGFLSWAHNNWIADCLVTASYNRFRKGRKVSAGTVANSTHGGYQITPGVSLGYMHQLNKQWSIVPNIASTFMYSHENKYQEKDAGSNNLGVRRRLSSQIRTKAGIDINHHRTHNFGKALYGIGLGMTLETPLKRGHIHGISGGSAFRVTANEKTTVMGNLHLTSGIAFHSNWNLMASYVGDYGTRYHAHEVSLKLTKKLS